MKNIIELSKSKDLEDNYIKLDKTKKLIGVNKFKEVNVVKIQPKDNPTRFLTIGEGYDGNQSDNKFYVNITSGTIQNPSKNVNATWWNYGDRNYNYQELKKVMKDFGINVNDKYENGGFTNNVYNRGGAVKGATFNYRKEDYYIKKVEDGIIYTTTGKMFTLKTLESNGVKFNKERTKETSPRGVRGQRREDMEDKLTELKYELKGYRSDLRNLFQEMDYEAGQKGEKWSDADANRYGGEMNEVEEKIEKLQNQIKTIEEKLSYEDGGLVNTYLEQLASDEREEGKKAKVYEANFDGKTIEAQTTEKTFPDGVPIMKTFSKYKSVTIKGKHKIVESENWWYFKINNTWYAVNRKKYGTPPFEYENGGEHITFARKSKAIAKQFSGKQVEPKYQRTYGKRYNKEEAKEVGNKIAGKMKATYDKKAFGGLFNKVIKPQSINLEQRQVMLKSGEFVQVLDQSDDTLTVMDISELGSGLKPKRINISEVDMSSFMSGGKVEKKKTETTKKTTEKRGTAMQLAKQIRKEGEKWHDALRRATAQLKK